MTVHEEYGKSKADSPDLSVPSATAASYCSSPESAQENDSENSSVRRTLFKMNSEVESPLETNSKAASTVSSPKTRLVGRKMAHSPSGEKNGVVETGSTTSSQTTAIPAWNLSMKDAAEKNVEVPLNHFVLSRPIPLMAPPLSFSSDRTQTPYSSSSSSSSCERSQLLEEGELQWIADSTASNSAGKGKVTNNEYDDGEPGLKKQPPIIMEDPPEAPTSCNAALNLKPVQLAEMFLAFGQSARQRYQGSEQTNVTSPENPSPIKVVDSMTDEDVIGSPPPLMKYNYLSDSSNGSNRSQRGSELSRVRSLERELEVLRTNSHRDALIILNLKQAIDAQKELNSLKEVEITDKQTDIQLSEERIKTLEKEQEDFVERETDLVETIEILKNELDKLTSLKSVPSDELDHLKLESVTEGGSENVVMDTALESFQVKDRYDRIAELESALKEKEKENDDLASKIDWLNRQQQRDAMKNENDPVTTANDPPKTEALRSSEVECLLKDIMKRLEVMENGKNGEISANVMEEAKTVHKARSIESEHNGVEVNFSKDKHAIETMSVKGERGRGTELDNGANWCCDWSSLMTGE